MGQVAQIIPIRQKSERLLRPAAFCQQIGETLGVPAPSERWLRYRIQEGLPSRKVLKRYRMIPVDPAMKWLRDNGYMEG